MVEYLGSLTRLERLRLSRLAPGHGDVIDDARPRIHEYVVHRQDRERQVLKLLEGGPARIRDMVDTLYGDRDLHPKLVEAAGAQLHAHLLKLRGEGRVTGTSVRAVWSLA
jgi:glyoxylase-like metal-dependent hydrolase (beta-lactamase superfamily II)